MAWPPRLFGQFPSHIFLNSIRVANRHVCQTSSSTCIRQLSIMIYVVDINSFCCNQWDTSIIPTPCMVRRIKFKRNFPHRSAPPEYKYLLAECFFTFYIPKKLQTLVTFVSLGHSMIALIFSRSTDIPSFFTICPRKDTFFNRN